MRVREQPRKWETQLQKELAYIKSTASARPFKILKRIEENAGAFGWELTKEEVDDLTTDLYEPCAWDPTKEPV